MKKISILLCTLTLVLGCFGAASATVWFTTNVGGDGNSFVSPYESNSGFLTETFDLPTGGPGFVQSWGWSYGGGGGAIVSGSVSSAYAAPMGATQQDLTHYLAVSNGFATAALGQTYNYLGIWWGSIDTYNTLSFYLGQNLVASFTGTDIAGIYANGSWTGSGSNLYVNFLLSGFDSFTITSNGIAFESDNITVGKVPEPTVLLLLGSGLLGLAGLRRKFRA
jgi:hypothetical protein